MSGRVCALVGAQFGSEGKGVVSYDIKDEFNIAVRTGGPNAGHSFVHDGILYKMQSIPCTWPNPECLLVLGAGALININILKHELDVISKVFPDIRERLLVDASAGILEERHHNEEGGTFGELHHRIGSTGEGVGAARRDRLARNPDVFRLASAASQELKKIGVNVIADTAQILNTAVKRGVNLLLEGTQGCGLSLIHGYWPSVTTNDTNAAQLAADAGIPPQNVTDVIMVARTYPIRVAGPSGPLKNELSWDDISIKVGREVVEHTTVTKKERRIGEWDEQLFVKAVSINAPSSIALTFMDYLNPEDEGKTELDTLSKESRAFIQYIERISGAGVKWVGTGFNKERGWSCVRINS